MRVALVLLSTLFASIAPGTFANAENIGVNVLLSDAQYAVNRYEELEGGVVCTTWKAPPSLQNSCSHAYFAQGRPAIHGKAVHGFTPCRSTARDAGRV